MIEGSLERTKMLPTYARRSPFLLLLLCMINAAKMGMAADSSALEFFETRIRPVLASHCYDCHGAEKQESDLRLDHPSFLLADGAFGTI